MERLTGKKAADRLDEWWDVLAKSSKQFVGHVLTPNTGQYGFYNREPARARYLRGGPRAVVEARAMLAPVVATWSYVAQANASRAKGNDNIRVLIIPDAALANNKSWQRYGTDIHWPVVAAFTYERILVLTTEQCLAAGIPIRPYDANIWGNNGVMRTGYRFSRRPGFDDQVAWREFASGPDDPDAREDYDYVIRVTNYARHAGQPIDPAELPAFLPPPVQPERNVHPSTRTWSRAHQVLHHVRTLKTGCRCPASPS